MKWPATVGQTMPPDDRRCNCGTSLDCVAAPMAPDDAKSGRAWSMATLATHAMRQALAALDLGRVDLAREILSNAVREPPCAACSADDPPAGAG